MAVTNSPKNLERRIKKQIHGQRHKALVRFPKGLGEICLREVSAALASPIFKEGGSCNATDAAIVIDDIGFRELAALALRLTTAREILWLIGEKKTTSKSELRTLLEKITWDLYLPAGATVALRVTSMASRLYHESMIKELASKTLEKLGHETTTTTTANYLIDLRLVHDRMTIALGLSATAIHRRGYKTIMKGLASVKEDLAAGSVQLALTDLAGLPSFKPDLVFVPFAGSGTLAFEAALALEGIAPACFMPPTSIETMTCMPDATRAFIRRKLQVAGPGANSPTQYSLVEIDQEQVDFLRANVAGFNAKLESLNREPCSFAVLTGDALDKKTWPTIGEKILVLLNPPYGDRIEANMKKNESLYATIGQRLEELARRAEVRGSVFTPTANAAADIESAAPSLSWSRTAISHGGRPIFLLRFAKER